MTEHDSAAIAREFFEAWNERDFDRGATLVADDGELVEVATNERYTGADGLRQEYDKWANAFPDGRVQIRNSFSAGEWAVTESTFRGTNNGTFIGAAGEIPATGRELDFEFCTVTRVRDGRIALVRHYHDNATIMQQLGLMPEGAAAPA